MFDGHLWAIFFNPNMVTCRPPNLEGLGDLGPSPSRKSLPAAGFTQGTPEGIPLVDFLLGN